MPKKWSKIGCNTAKSVIDGGVISGISGGCGNPVSDIMGKKSITDGGDI